MTPSPELRDVLATVEDIDLWPPWDAAQTIVDAVAQAIEIATEPPDPEPGDLTTAASVWRRIATSVDSGCDELADLPHAHRHHRVGRHRRRRLPHLDRAAAHPHRHRPARRPRRGHRPRHPRRGHDVGP